MSGQSQAWRPDCEVTYLAAGKEAWLREPVKSEFSLSLPQALLLYLTGDWLKLKSLSVPIVKQDMQEMELK